MNFVKPLIIASIVAYASGTTTEAPKGDIKGDKAILTAEQIAAIRKAAMVSVDTCLTSGKKAKDCAKDFRSTLKTQKEASKAKLNKGQALAEFKAAVAEVVFDKFTTCMKENKDEDEDPRRNVCFQKIQDLGLAKNEIKKIIMKGADGKAADEFRSCKKAAADDAAAKACKDSAKEKLKSAFPKGKLSDDEAEREMKKGLAKEAVTVFKTCMQDSTTTEEKAACVAARKGAKPDWISDKEAKFYYRRASWAIALDTYQGCMEDEEVKSSASACGDAAKEDYLAAGGKPYTDFVAKLVAKYADKDKVKVLRKLNKIALSLELEGLTKDEVIAKLATLKAKINSDTGATFGDGNAEESTSGSIEVDFGDSPCTDCAAQLATVDADAEASAAAGLADKRRRLLATTVTASSEQSLEEVTVEDGDWISDDSAAAGLRSSAAFVAAAAFALQFLM